MTGTVSSPLVVTVTGAGGPRRIELRDRTAARLLRALVDARGSWITPTSMSMRGPTLTRRAADLRRRYGLRIETEAIRTEGGFQNRHRLGQAVTIEGDGGSIQA